MECTSGSALPVDFLIEYRTSRSFLIAGSASAEHTRVEPTGLVSSSTELRAPDTAKPLSAIDEEYELQMRVHMRRDGRNGRASRFETFAR